MTGNKRSADNHKVLKHSFIVYLFIRADIDCISVVHFYFEVCDLKIIIAVISSSAETSSHPLCLAYLLSNVNTFSNSTLFEFTIS